MSGGFGSLNSPAPVNSMSAVRLPGARLDPPQLSLRVPARVGHLVAVADVLVGAVLAGDPPQVLPDLGLGRERLAPVRVGCERERVQVRRHVARAAGVGVIAPGAPELLGPLEHDEVVDVVLLEADSDAQAGEAGARRSRCAGAGSRARGKRTLVVSAHDHARSSLAGVRARRGAAPSRALLRGAAGRVPGRARRAQPGDQRGDLAQRRGRSGRRRGGRSPPGGRRASAVPRCAAAHQGPHASGRVAGELRLARSARRA